MRLDIFLKSDKIAHSFPGGVFDKTSNSITKVIDIVTGQKVSLRRDYERKPA